MRGRYYVKLLGCDCGREHTLVDPDFYHTLQTKWEVPQQFHSLENARDTGIHFVAWNIGEGGTFDGFEIEGVH